MFVYDLSGKARKNICGGTSPVKTKKTNKKGANPITEVKE
jgi:hypothetical protein